MNIQIAHKFRIQPTHFYTQVHHPIYNPQGVEKTEDCGPTCLAMVLSMLGLRQDLAHTVPLPCHGTQGLIDRARYAMFGSSRPEKSTYLQDAEGHWRIQESARHTLSNLHDLERGAKLFSVNTAPVQGLAQLKECGTPAIIAGDPSIPGAHGKRLGIDYSGGHFILVKSWSPTGEFEVYDPLCLRGVARVSRVELERFTSAGIFGTTLGLSFSLG